MTKTTKHTYTFTGLVDEDFPTLAGLGYGTLTPGQEVVLDEPVDHQRLAAADQHTKTATARFAKAQAALAPDAPEVEPAHEVEDEVEDATTEGDAVSEVGAEAPPAE
jgi:hypothetical protein